MFRDLAALFLTRVDILLCCSNVVQVPLSLNPFQLNLEFGTTHQVALCVVHPSVI